LGAEPPRAVPRGLSKPLIWANRRALGSRLEMRFGLKQLGPRPTEPIEETLHRATSIETPGFYKAAIKVKRITTIRGTVSAYTASGIMVDSREVSADVVVLAIGWHQEFPVLDAATRQKLVATDGPYQFPHMIVNPDIPGLGFVGSHSSFATPLFSELGAHWLARDIEGSLARMPSREAMKAEIEDADRLEARDPPGGAGLRRSLRRAGPPLSCRCADARHWSPPQGREPARRLFRANQPKGLWQALR